MEGSSLFVLLVCHIDISLTMMPLAILLVPLEKTEWVRMDWVVSQCFGSQWRIYWILKPKKRPTENSSKSKLKLIRKFWQALGIVRKLSLNRI